VPGPRSLPCSLVGFWYPKTADLLYKFSVRLPDLLYFRLTFGAKILIFRCGGQNFRFWALSQPFSPSARIFQRLFESCSSILSLQNQSHLGLMRMLCQKGSRAPQDLLYSSRTLLVSSLFYSIKWPEVGPFWDIDLLYGRPFIKVVTGGLACHR
jgi:hypothetical protein